MNYLKRRGVGSLVSPTPHTPKLLGEMALGQIWYIETIQHMERVFITLCLLLGIGNAYVKMVGRS